LSVNEGFLSARTKNTGPLSHFAKYIKQEWLVLHDQRCTCPDTGKQYLPSKFHEHNERRLLLKSENYLDIIKNDESSTLYKELQAGHYALAMVWDDASKPSHFPNLGLHSIGFELRQIFNCKLCGRKVSAARLHEHQCKQDPFSVSEWSINLVEPPDNFVCIDGKLKQRFIPFENKVNHATKDLLSKGFGLFFADTGRQVRATPVFLRSPPKTMAFGSGIYFHKNKESYDQLNAVPGKETWYRNMDFGPVGSKCMEIQYSSYSTGNIEFHIRDGDLIGTLELIHNTHLAGPVTVLLPLKGNLCGIQDLVVSTSSDTRYELHWFRLVPTRRSTEFYFFRNGSDYHSMITDSREEQNRDSEDRTPVTNLTIGCVLNYQNLDFGLPGSKAIEIQYSSGDKYAYIELRLGSENGDLICQFHTHTAHELTAIIPLKHDVCGIQELVVVMKSMKPQLDMKFLDLYWFRLVPDRNLSLNYVTY